MLGWLLVVCLTLSLVFAMDRYKKVITRLFGEA